MGFAGPLNPDWQGNHFFIAYRIPCARQRSKFENHWSSPTLSFYRWANWGPKRLSDLSKVTQLVVEEPGLALRSLDFQSRALSTTSQYSKVGAGSALRSWLAVVFPAFRLMYAGNVCWMPNCIVQKKMYRMWKYTLESWRQTQSINI